MLVGKDARALNILQAFIDNTRDVQTAGLVSANLIILQYKEQHDKLKRHYKNYKNLLNNIGMYEPRNALDKEFRSQVITYKAMEGDTTSAASSSKDHHLSKSKISIACKNCNNC